MRALTMSGLSILLLSIYSFGGIKDGTKHTYNSFTAGPAVALSNTSAMTLPTTNMKKLLPGWEAGWTFFSTPFQELENGLSGLAFGGKVRYSRWERDSTFTPVTFLGVQGIVRYYTPPLIKPLDLFIQAGGGWFIGEYSFSDPDTIDWTSPDFEPIVHKGKNCLGVDIAVGANIDVVEIMPIVTMVFTKNEASVWMSLKFGMAF